MSDSSERPPRGFGRFKKQAETLVNDPRAVAGLLESAALKAGKGGIERVRADLLDMLRLLKAYFKGDYRRVPWTTIITAVGGVLYFVNPMDLIPDFLVGPGLLDDAAVLTFCLNALRHDLREFILWEKTSAPKP